MKNDYRNPNFPWHVPFATNAGSQTMPDAGELAAGWPVNARVPARKLNWLLDKHRNGERIAVQRAIGDFNIMKSPVIQVNPSASSARCTAGIVKWNMGHEFSAPGYSYWLALSASKTSTVNPDNIRLLRSVDGITWEQSIDAGELPGFATMPKRDNLIITSDNKVHFVAGSPNITLYSASDPWGGAFSGSTVASASTASCIAAETDGEAIMVGTTAGLVHTRTTAAGAWVGRTLRAGVSVESIVHLSGLLWLALTKDGGLFVTFDGGNSWTLRKELNTVLGAFDEFTSVERGLTGRVCVSARQSAYGNLRLIYSDDLYNWQPATLPTGMSDTGFILPATEITAARLMNLGGTCWICSGGIHEQAVYTLSASNMYLLVSVDDGATWSLGNRLSSDYVDAAASSYSEVWSTGFDGHRVIGAGAHSMIYGCYNG